MTTTRFFMIGSWTEGMLHFEKLQPFIISYESASIRASAFRLPVGFPVIVNSPKYEVPGTLVELNTDPTLLALLDTFYGVRPNDVSKGLHQRLSVEIKKVSGGTEIAQVYFFNPKKLTHKSVEIESGDWKKSLEENPPLPLTLTEKQKSYILKLGAVKGRDIVPINDLTLYRELMKLELIVDKGRRLALSSLGKDVYNHLS